MSARVAAWSIAILTLLAVAAAASLAWVNRASIGSLYQANAVEIVLPIGYATLGALVASRQPRNALGWVLLAIGLFTAIPGVATQYTRYALITEQQAPFTAWIPWSGFVASTLVYPAGLAPAALLLIPSGRLLSPRWAWVLWSCIVLTLLLLVVTALDPQGMDIRSVAGAPNPTSVPGLDRLSLSPLGIALYLAGLGTVAAAGASVVLRLRRSRGEEALQMRWIAWTTSFAVVLNVGVIVVALLVVPVDQINTLTVITVIAGFAIAMPVGLTVAMLRYRLYDLDLFLNRTVLYGAVSVVLLVVFGAANVLAQAALQSAFGQSSNLLAAAVGLGAGLAVAPVRHRLRPVVDRILPARARLTLLFTDIVGSTQAIVDLGDERWREVLDQYRTVVRHNLARYRGREVNTAGDAFFAVFDRPDNAVRCAVSMRDDVAELGLRVRTGLHIGDVEVRGEQVSGLAVHAAARVMGSAGAGEILVSGDVAELLSGVSLRDAGSRTLRGVPGEYHLFEIAAAGS
jgi:class 3 adenylate cyclase